MVYDNGDKYDEIVEKNRLRPVNTKEPLKAGDYMQVQIPVSPSLLEWVQTAEEAERSLAEIRTKSNSLIVCFSSDRKSIQVVGREDSTETAKLLIDVVLSHQAEVLQRYASSKKDPSPPKEESTEEIELDEAILPLLGGLKGTYFETVRTKHNVVLSLAEGRGSAGKSLIRIKASSENMAAAKKDLQLSAKRVVLLLSEEARLKSKFAELQKKSKVVCTTNSTTTEEAANSKVALTAIGTEESLRNYSLAIQTSLALESQYPESPPPDLAPAPAAAEPPEDPSTAPRHYSIADPNRRGSTRRRQGGKSSQYSYSGVKYVKKQ